MIAVDPGKTGGWAMFFGRELVEWDRLPVTGKDYDWGACAQLVRADREPGPVLLEAVNAGACMSKSSAFSLGGCAEGWRALAATLGVPLILVRPAEWTKVMVSGAKKRDKDQHRADAMRLYPHAADDLRRKQDDGIADAILIGAYWLDSRAG